MLINWTLGTDPEVFIKYPDNRFYSAYDGFGTVIKGTKKDPEPTPYGAIQVDGMAVEFNTHPTADPKEFSNLIQQGLDDILARHPGRMLNPGCVVNFAPEWLKAQPLAAVELGCDPDFNPYKDGQANERPNMEHPLRTAGGHVHVGWPGANATDPNHLKMCIEVAKQLDWFLGIWSLDKDAGGNVRRQLYGMPGAFRVKPYGMEYRYLSNFWVFAPELREEVAKRTIAAMDCLVANWSAVRYFGSALPFLKGALGHERQAVVIDNQINLMWEKRDAA